MQTYVIDHKTLGSISAAAEELVRCIDTSTDHGRVLCGTSIKAALPWDASPNWELRHKPPTDALLIHGMPVTQNGEDMTDEVLCLVALMTGMKRGMPWGWAHQSSIFETITSAAQYAAAEGIAVDALSIPRVAMASSLSLAPEVVVLAASGEHDGLRVGWVNSAELTEHMPRELRKGAEELSFHANGCSSALPLLYPVVDPLQPAQLGLGTGGIQADDGASNLAIGALEYLRAVAAEKMAWINLKPGQALVLPNRFGQHAIEFEGRAAVRRVYWNRDLRSHRQHRAETNPLAYVMPSFATAGLVAPAPLLATGQSGEGARLPMALDIVSHPLH